MRALIVDDNPAERDLMVAYLRRHGWETHEAETGREALVIGEADHPDVVISDGLMPDMDGFQFLREVRRGSMKDVVFVFYTGVYTGKQDEDFAISLGADAFVMKPKPPWDILKEIYGALARRYDRPQIQEMDEETYLRRYSAVLASKLQERLELAQRQQREGKPVPVPPEAVPAPAALPPTGAFRTFPELRSLPEGVPHLLRYLIAIEQAGGELRELLPRDRGEGFHYVTQVVTAAERVAKAGEQMLRSSRQRPEIMQPLKRMHVFIGMLKLEYAKALPAEARPALERMERDSRLVTSMIEDIQDLLRAVAVELRRDEVNLSLLAGKILGDLTRTAPHRDVQLSVEEDCVVTADATMSRLLIGKLLENAWKFTGKRHVTKISFGKARHGGRDFFFVEDNGVGFDATRKGELFRPFSRLHDEAEFEGTGLGLAIASVIARRHGGGISASGELQNGAVFTFSLASPSSWVSKA